MIITKDYIIEGKLIKKNSNLIVETTDYYKNFYEPLEISRLFEKILYNISSCSLPYKFNSEYFTKYKRERMVNRLSEVFNLDPINNHGSIERMGTGTELYEYILDWLCLEKKGIEAFCRYVWDELIEFINSPYTDTYLGLNELKRYIEKWIDPKFITYIEKNVKRKLSPDWEDII
jgi:hypothetical protein